jgi:hypothetical protein
MTKIRVLARAGSALAAVVAVSLLSGSAFGGAATPDISGTYWAPEYKMKLELVGGGELPLNEAGRALYARTIAGLQDGSITDAARRFCVPDGVPRSNATPYPFEIIQAPPGQITMVHELNHQIRVIAMDKPPQTLEQLIAFPFYNGHSTGRWEGDTLVVHTNGFNEKTFLDATGAPHSDQLEVTERYRKISPTQLEVVATIHDPFYYTRDFSTRFVYNLRNEVRLEDYVCGEEHRDISGIRGIPEARAANATRAAPR